MTGHRRYAAVGTGCIRAQCGTRTHKQAPTQRPLFINIDNQPSLLPEIIAARHRALLAKNGEDTW